VLRQKVCVVIVGILIRGKRPIVSITGVFPSGGYAHQGRIPIGELSPFALIGISCLWIEMNDRS